MKSLIITVITSLVLLSQFLDYSSIKSHSQLNYQIDYRESVVGNYFCQVTSTAFKALERSNFTQDTVTIVVTKSSTDSLLLVKIKDKKYEFKLRNNLLLGHPHKGKFIGVDGIYINMATGHASSKNFVGRKI